MNFAIIAAGEGSRLHNEGAQAPKPLVTIGGRELILRLLDIFDACGARSISIITNPSMPEVAAKLRSEAHKFKATLRLCEQSTPSSMHSMAAMNLEEIGGKVCATTVDTVFSPTDFAAYIKAFEADAEAEAFMAVTTLIDDEKPLYVDLDPSTMRITAFRDAPWEGVKYVSGGIYGLTPKALEVLRCCLDSGVSRMRGFQRALLDAGLNVKAFVIDRIIDVDHLSDIPKAEAIISG